MYTKLKKKKNVVAILLEFTVNNIAVKETNQIVQNKIEPQQKRKN
jgi:hypothetical protein